ncbi:hypothetical protein B0J13DRAFT_588422 [Dactylonectria estremocensis]|uniref:Uncharacterized protein n=1 Tax=Dactylonectria estremocensis TaxID=1079267 RepID=A0A9P9E1W2_9HYPO|nr:hypothetical protein B0J13DRAFT_588422 [Dactylonectria estremocensis]
MAINYYNCDSSLAAAMIFILGYAISSLLHIYQIFKTKTRFFIPFLIGSLCTPYVMRSLLLLLGSICYATSINIVLGRLIRFLKAEEWSFISIEGGKLVNAETADDRSKGESITIGSLVFQILFFSLFKYTMEHNSELQSKEVYIYVLGAALMLVASFPPVQVSCFWRADC